MAHWQPIIEKCKKWSKTVDQTVEHTVPTFDEAYQCLLTGNLHQLVALVLEKSLFIVWTPKIRKLY